MAKQSFSGLPSKPPTGPQKAVNASPAKSARVPSSYSVKNDQAPRITNTPQAGPVHQPAQEVAPPPSAERRVDVARSMSQPQKAMSAPAGKLKAGPGAPGAVGNILGPVGSPSTTSETRQHRPAAGASKPGPGESVADYYAARAAAEKKAEEEAKANIIPTLNVA